MPSPTGSRVNTQAGGEQYDPAVLRLTGGGYVITWVGDGQDGSGSGVYMQRFGPDGAAIGAETRVNTETVNAQFAPQGTGLSGGGYVIVYASTATGSADIYAQRFTGSGQLAGSETRVNSVTTNSQLDPAVTALTDGGYVVVWTNRDSSAHKLGIFAQRYDASGVAVGGEFQVNSNAALAQSHPDVAALADGGFVVVWDDDSGRDGSAAGVFSQRYNASGAKVGGETQVNLFTTDDQLAPKIITLTDGGYLIAWTRMNYAAQSDGVFSQRYDATGATVGGENRIDGNSGQATEVSFTALADGGYMATWVRTTDRVDVVAQRFDANNINVGPETIITPSAQTHGAPDIVQLVGGQVVIVWDAPNVTPPQMPNFDAYQSLFSNAAAVAQTQYLFGTAAGETLDGRLGFTTMWGGFGDDTYSVDDSSDVAVEGANQGRDTVQSSVSYSIATQYVENLTLTGSGNTSATGNGLANTLTGNAGANLLDGRVGADVMSGGLGNDTYYVDNAGDVVTESLSGGADTVLSSVSFTLGNHVENLALRGNQAISATGNAFDNSLTGNGAGNVISGAEGDDWIRGLGGSDTLNGGTGADAFVFEAPGQANGFDRLVDFQSGVDQLVFRGTAFGFARGYHLSAGNISLTGQASGGGAQFIYNPVSHKLYWDADGSSAGAPIAICVFDNGAAPAASDFVFL